MSKTQILVVRLSKSQKEKVMMDAQNMGYKTVAHYIRNLILETHVPIERELNEIYDRIVKVHKIEEKSEEVVLTRADVR